MSNELVFYTNPMSRGRIVRWMLEEIAQPYQTQLLEYGGNMKSAEFLAINPMGKVPALKHGDVVITECAAICVYLADVFPQAQLAPALTDRLRGAYYRWMFYGAGPVEAATSNQALGLELPNDPKKRGMLGYGSLNQVTAVLEGLVAKSTYILGEQFSAVDIYLGSQIGWGTHFGTLEKRPAFTEYLARIMGRPAAVRARRIDDELLAQVKGS